MSIHEQLKALDEQRVKLVENAKATALEKVRAGIAELNELGFHYGLVDGTDKPRSPIKEKSGAKATKRQLKNVACPVCGFRTSPPHDARSHRGQNPKRAFTTEELTAKKLSKVG
jgi:hypothetical protein